jgi:hypothetical protein
VEAALDGGVGGRADGVRDVVADEGMEALEGAGGGEALRVGVEGERGGRLEAVADDGEAEAEDRRGRAAGRVRGAATWRGHASSTRGAGHRVTCRRTGSTSSASSWATTSCCMAAVTADGEGRPEGELAEGAVAEELEVEVLGGRDAVVAGARVDLRDPRAVDSEGEVEVVVAEAAQRAAGDVGGVVDPDLLAAGAGRAGDGVGGVGEAHEVAVGRVVVAAAGDEGRGEHAPPGGAQVADELAGRDLEGEQARGRPVLTGRRARSTRSA